MDQYVNPGLVEGPIEGAVSVDSFSPGATLQLGRNGKAFTISGRDTEIAPRGGWDAVLTTGTVTLKVYKARLEAHERPGPRSPSNPGQTSTATSEQADVLNVAAGAAVQLLATNPLRRRLTIQNLSTQVVFISRDPAIAAAVAAGSKIEAVLAASAVANDGTGGAITIDGWSGPIYARVAAGASLVAVEAY